jgi:glycosyltransferase involved in cell wall biosynthesis
VASILAQTFTSFNLLVLDNQSSDGTLEWINSLEDKRISCHPSANPLSIVENWARIKHIQKNEFITLIGHDDVLYPDYLSTMDALIRTHPNASLYQSHFNYINGIGEFVRPCMPMDEQQYGHEFLACQLAQTIDSMGTGYMMRSSDFDRLGGMPENYPNLIFADYQLWVQLSMKSYKATSSKFCFSYRVHDSVSRLTNGFEYQDAFGKYMLFINSLKGDPAITNAINNYAYDYLMYFCESLSHRILKSHEKGRVVSVENFVRKCEGYAALLLPGKKFEPMKRRRIWLAHMLDRSSATRSGFRLFKKFIK